MSACQERRFSERVVSLGAGEDRGQPGRFVRGQVGGGFSEVMASRGFGPVHAASPFRDIEVQLEDPRLGQPVFERAGDQSLAGLAKQRALGRQIQIFRQLLGNGAPASLEFTRFEIVQRGVANAFPVESLMDEEGGVLGRDHGALQLGRDPAQGCPDPLSLAGASLFGSFCQPMVHERRRSRVDPGKQLGVGKGAEPAQR